MKFKIYVYALILFDHEDKILLRHKKDSNLYHLPGVEVIIGQSAEKCLKTYLDDQLKIVSSDLFFIGTMEEINENDHIYALFFKATQLEDILSLPNDDFIYEWKNIPLPKDLKSDPEYLKEDLSRWLKGKAIFLSTENRAFSM